MGTWNDLPTELAIIILHLLDPESDHRRPQRIHPYVNQNILHCTYVSQQFNDITMPILYREVNIAAEYRYTSKDDPFRRLRHLTRTVVSRPQLGRLIQALEIPSLPNGIDDPEDIDSSLSPDDVDNTLGTETSEVQADLRILLDAAIRLGLPNGLIIHGKLVGELFLLLHHLPRLRKLHLKMRDDIRMVALSALGCFARGVPAGLQSLLELSIFDASFEGGFGAGDVVPFMMLPSLTSFNVSGFVGQERDRQWFRIGEPYDSNTSVINDNLGKSSETSRSPLNEHTSKSFGIVKTSSGYTLLPKSSPVTSLDLEMSAVSGTLLNHLLTLPAALERFQYDVDWEMLVGGAFVPSQFLPGLLAQANSLKELVIDIKHVSDSTEGNLPIGSLAELHVVERLAVPVGLLLMYGPADSDVAAQNPLDTLLPPSLVTLELSLDRAWWGGLGRLMTITGIPETLPTTARHIPTLRHIVIHRTRYPDTFQLQEAALAEASRICPQITLEFKVSTAYFG